MNSEAKKILSDNRKARFNYTVLESLECGIELKGTEVKSMKNGKFAFTDSYARIQNNELWLVGLHITPYFFGNIHNHDPDRNKRLLAHSQEIKKLKRKTDERGFTLIPLDFHLVNGLVKCKLGVCQGKRQFDKRESIKKKDQKRDSDREMRRY